ncbi:hypothetical protein JGH11_15330 [Dysgonomonas sp. Marseille-P4677]|uniref:hypothetical protein n=1 Tax=Dysgonomonas sp. Marseille-P4677 TaxID=2364790 RepID=UPI001911558E|nr:hypothetical protein [Dysgonomonas sp. Marseille-P4677]MBK5722247.1 hypothetical protein [Dysgonomonas sp. Marseille-P4677]
MANLELYINQQLCETENPETFSVYLKRQLLNPAELSTKDAQRSYDITLPATTVNNEIFRYINTEEVKGKFSQLYDAQLIVNGIKIFDGKFKMSEITKTYYKGNLGIPAQKTVKDIFGEMKMNQAGKWLVDFKGITDITEYNKGIAKDSKACFFPFVLYGLLPKEPKEYGKYTAKDLFDETVKLRLNHIPPSVNCLETIKQIFKGEGLDITGTAFNDERLKDLCMSYQNPPEYQMPWNFGELAKMRIKGNWANVRSDRGEIQYWRHVDNKYFVIADLLNSSTLEIVEPIEDPGYNIHQFQTNVEGQEVKHNVINIPHDGFYKITLDVKISVDTVKNWAYPYRDFFVISGHHSDGNWNLNNSRFEVKLLRYKDGEEKQLDRDFGFDNVFYKENIDQTEDDTYPKYYPQPGGINFIDTKQSPHLICGFSFNESSWEHNPVDTEGIRRNVLVKKSGESWDKNLSGKELTAVNCPVYYKAEKTEDGTIDYNPRSDKYTMSLLNTPFRNEIRRNSDGFGGDGKICMIAWFDKNDKLTLATNSDMEKFFTIKGLSFYGWIVHTIDFDLSIEAFQTEKNWLQVNDQWTGTGNMYWNDDSTFLSDKLDLTKFLPSTIKINDWLENFCKVFNLSLIQTEQTSFELNTPQNRNLNITSIIDMDEKADVNTVRRNSSIALPSVYEIGFTVDKQEEGYDKSEYDDGGGKYETGSLELKKINQTSFFSYNWLKKIRNQIIDNELNIPVVSDKKVWDDTTLDYQKMQEENYIDKAQRFWYRTEDTFPTDVNGNKDIELGLVSTQMNGYKSMILNYKNEKDSILNNYFTLLTDADNCYTTIECFLSPEEYIRIPDSWVKFNGDLYYVAEIDGYDPSCKKKATLKLIRKIQ